MSATFLLFLGEIAGGYFAWKAPWAWMRFGYAFLSGGFVTLAILKYTGAIE